MIWSKSCSFGASRRRRERSRSSLGSCSRKLLKQFDKLMRKEPSRVPGSNLRWRLRPKSSKLTRGPVAAWHTAIRNCLTDFVEREKTFLSNFHWDQLSEFQKTVIFDKNFHCTTYDVNWVQSIVRFEPCIIAYFAPLSKLWGPISLSYPLGITLPFFQSSLKQHLSHPDVH